MARLSVENVSVDFGGIHALRDVSFELESGAIVGLIGPNGAGKSTLLNCVSGITRPTQGRVRLDGAVLSALPPATVAGCGIGRPELRRRNTCQCCRANLSLRRPGEPLPPIRGHRSPKMTHQHGSLH